ERDREQQPLLLAAGELAGVAPRELLQGAQADELIDLEPVGVEPAEQRDRLAHGEKVLQRGPLEENAGVLAKARAERLAAVAYLAGGRRQDPLHDLDGGGLAGAVRAEQAETDAFGHAERHAGHGGGAGVLLDEVLDFEDGGAHGRGILADYADGALSLGRASCRGSGDVYHRSPWVTVDTTRPSASSSPTSRCTGISARRSPTANTCTSTSSSRPRSRSPASTTRCCSSSCTRCRRSEEHTSELQSLAYLVCRLLLEKKKHHIHTTGHNHHWTVL